MSHLAAVAVLHAGQDLAVLRPDGGFDLRDLGELSPQLVAVALDGVAHPMKPQLLIEGAVGGGALVGAGIPGVVKCLAVAGPRHHAAGGAIGHVVDDVGQFSAGGGVVEMQIAALGAPLGHGHGDLAAIGRYREPVDAQRALGVELGGVQDHALAGEVLAILEHDQHRLFFGWLDLEQEDLSGVQVGRAVGRARVEVELFDTSGDGGQIGQGVEVGPGVAVLPGGPGDHRRVACVLQPSIGIAHRDAVIGIGGRANLGHRRSCGLCPRAGGKRLRRWGGRHAAGCERGGERDKDERLHARTICRDRPGCHGSCERTRMRGTPRKKELGPGFAVRHRHVGGLAEDRHPIVGLKDPFPGAVEGQAGGDERPGSRRCRPDSRRCRPWIRRFGPVRPPRGGCARPARTGAGRRRVRLRTRRRPHGTRARCRRHTHCTSA